VTLDSNTANLSEDLTSVERQHLPDNTQRGLITLSVYWALRDLTQGTQLRSGRIYTGSWVWSHGLSRGREPVTFGGGSGCILFSVI
jgi:hypothetical protein